MKTINFCNNNALKKKDDESTENIISRPEIIGLIVPFKFLVQSCSFKKYI
jgi:hypothetical protein